jgi:hypothetical protein
MKQGNEELNASLLQFLSLFNFFILTSYLAYNLDIICCHEQNVFCSQLSSDVKYTKYTSPGGFSALHNVAVCITE